MSNTENSNNVGNVATDVPTTKADTKTHIDGLNNPLLSAAKVTQTVSDAPAAPARIYAKKSSTNSASQNKSDAGNKVDSTKHLKKKRKNILRAVVHIRITFNNTIVTFTDEHGNTIAQSSAGSNGFKGSKKSTPYAAQTTVNAAVKKVIPYSVKTIDIIMIGPGMQREPALKAMFNHGFYVASITDASSVPHNGTRAPKRRRV